MRILQQLHSVNQSFWYCEGNCGSCLGKLENCVVSVFPCAGPTRLTTLTSRDPGALVARCSGESRYVCSDYQRPGRSVQTKRQEASLTSLTYRIVGHLFYVYENSFPFRVYEINCRRSGLPGFFAVFAHYR